MMLVCPESSRFFEGVVAHLRWFNVCRTRVSDEPAPAHPICHADLGHDGPAAGANGRSPRTGHGAVDGPSPGTITQRPASAA